MERSPELQEMIVDWWHAFSRGDGSWFERHVSRGAAVRLAGTDSNEWLEGQRVGEFLKGAVEALGGTLKISPASPSPSVRATSAGGTRARLSPCRAGTRSIFAGAPSFAATTASGRPCRSMPPSPSPTRSY